MSDITIYRGSVADIARRDGKSVAEVAMDATDVLIIDTSGSMLGTPYEKACQEMRRLQERQPGRYLVYSGSTDTVFCPGGEPLYLGDGTAMHKWLECVKEYDGTGMRFTLISDGMPDDGIATLAVAATFEDQINTIYVGMDDAGAIRFLQELARASGGKFARGKVDDIEKKVNQLLLTTHTGPIQL